MTEKPLTKLMRSFLLTAAQAEPGKGIMLNRSEKRIASMASRAGYGWQIVSPIPLFIMTEKGREVLKNSQ